MHPFVSRFYTLLTDIFLCLLQLFDIPDMWTGWFGLHMLVLNFIEIFMHEADRHAAFSYGRSHPVHGARTDVPCREYAGTAGLQQVRIPLLLPDLAENIMGLQVATRLQEP